MSGRSGERACVRACACVCLILSTPIPSVLLPSRRICVNQLSSDMPFDHLNFQEHLSYLSLKLDQCLGMRDHFKQQKSRKMICVTCIGEWIHLAAYRPTIYFSKSSMICQTVFRVHDIINCIYCSHAFSLFTRFFV